MHRRLRRGRLSRYKIMGTSIRIGAWVLLLAAPSFGLQDTRALIEQALDERTNIALENLPLRDVLAALTEKTGIKMSVRPDALAIAPNGADTLFSKVSIPNVPLRRGLAEVFAPLGLTFVVLDNGIEFVSKPALRGFDRPLNWGEVDTLSLLSKMQPGLDAKALASLEPRIQFQVPATNPWSKLSDAMSKVGAGPGDEVLTVACGNLGWAWHPSGQLIVVTTLEQQVRRRLQKPISLRLTNRPLAEVIQAVGRSADIDIRVEPGAMSTLPRHVAQGFSINVPRQPAEDVLDQIAASTGLGYLIERDGVYFYRAADAGATRQASFTAPAPPPPGADPYVAKITVPLDDGRSWEWLIRRSELPEDLLQVRDRDIAEVIEALRAKSGSKGAANP